MDTRPHPLNRQRVHVVDADRTAGMAVCRMLEEAGFEPLLHTTTCTLLGKIRTRPGDCMLIDIRPREMADLAVLEGLAADLPVIVMGREVDVDTAVSAMRAGAADVIAHPFAPDEIARRVLGASRTPPQRPPQQRNAMVDETAAHRLTPREMQVLEEIVEGEPTKRIARKLGISPRTVEVHRSRVMEKMQARNVAHLVRISVGTGISAA